MFIQKLLTNGRNIFTSGTRIMILAMIMDFFAWGFIDPFFSTFAKSLLDNLALVGLIVALKGLAGLLALAPLSEIIVVKSARIVAIIGRFGAICTVGTYLAGGVYQIPFLLFFGAIFHGISGAARDVATRDYLMKASSKKNASIILGTNFSLRYTSWMIAAIISGFLVMYISETTFKQVPSVMPIIFGIVIPFFIISIFLVKKLPATKSTPFPFHALNPKEILKKQKKLLSKFSNLSPPLKYSMSLICFLQIVQSALLLFLPILAFELNLTISQVGLLMASMYAPMLLSTLFSIFEDRTDRMLFIIGGLTFSVIPLLLLSQVESPLLIGMCAVLIALSLAIIMPANLGTIAANTDTKDTSSIAALQIIFQRFGMLSGALLIGFVSQAYGVETAFILIAILAIIFAILAVFVRRYFKNEKKIPKDHPFLIHPLHHLHASHHTL